MKKEKFDAKKMNYAPLVSKEYVKLRNKYDSGYHYYTQDEEIRQGMTITLHRFSQFPEKWLTFDEMCKLEEKDKNLKFMGCDDIIESKYVYFCPHCHKIFETWNELAQESKCQLCGKKFTYVRYSFKDTTPYAANVFKMADGSKAISFLYKIYKLRHATSKKTGKLTVFNETKTIISRLVISRNGHTYVKAEQAITNRWDGEKYKMGKYLYGVRQPLRDITYDLSIDVKGQYSLISASVLNSSIKKLKEKNIIDIPSEIMKNRFRGLSDEMRTSLTNLLYNEGNAHVLNEQGEYFCKKLKNVIKKIKINTTDEEAIAILKKEIDIDHNGKKLRTLFYEDPFAITAIWMEFKRYGFKDVNNFFKVYTNFKNGRPYLNESIYEFKEYTYYVKQYTKKCGENAVVNAMISKDKGLLHDSFIYIKRIKENMFLNYNEYKVSVRKMHELAENFYRRNNQHYEYNNYMKRIQQIHEMMKEITEKEERVTLMERSIEMMEHIINVPIVYKQEERELEGTYKGHKFFLPEDTDSMITYGERLHNCVGRLYRNKALNKKCTIVIMKKDDKFTGCIEVCRGKIEQAYAPCNRELKDDAKEAFESWKKKNATVIKEKIKHGNRDKIYMRPQTLEIFYNKMYHKVEEKAAAAKTTQSSQIA